MTGYRRHALTAALLFSLIAASTPAQALACGVTPQSVPFGAYDTLAPGPADGVGMISVACDAETAFTVSVGPGAGSYDAREMHNGAEVLSYNLYTDASRVVGWSTEERRVGKEWVSTCRTRG